MTRLEQMDSKNHNRSLSFTLLMVRDGLVFLLCVLSVVLISVITTQRKAYATMQTEYKSTAASEETAVASVSAPLDAAVPTASADDAAQNTAATPEPTPQSAEEPAANGDFSATFPAYDTGADAMLSHQDDQLRIAIHKVQADDVTYFVADVWVKQIEAFHTAFAMDAYGRGLHETPLKMANEQKAIFAVSGDYYGAREDGLVVRNGELYRDVMSDDVCVLRRDGTMRVYQRGAFSALDDADDSVWQAWAFGPALVQNGAVCDTSSSKIKVKNPRCAIGYYAPGHYCFIVVDGRQSGYSEGMTLVELANTFADLGCETAYNLDGGATAMMVFEGSLVNHPTNGGRASSDIICF